MKKIIALFLVLTLCLVSCKSNNPQGIAANNTTITTETITSSPETTTTPLVTGAETSSDTVTSSETSTPYSDMTSNAETEIVPEFYSMDDPALLEYIENNVYAKLNSEGYSVENVQAIYLPDRYIKNLEFNSKENVYFGHTISELNELFQGKKYVFDLGDDGQTVVKEMEILNDDTQEKIIKNVAIGVGVIILCVTLSVVSKLLNAPEKVTVMFTTAAITATQTALNSSNYGRVCCSLVSGYEANNFNNMKKIGDLEASENFKWGAILGAFKGAAEGLKN